jgi:hypothetical protein
MALEQAGLGAEGDLGMVVLAGQRLDQRHRLVVGAHVEARVGDALFEGNAGAGLDRLHALAALARGGEVNDYIVQRYPAGCAGMSPHRDHIRYTGLVAIVMLGGRGVSRSATTGPAPTIAKFRPSPATCC